MHPNPNPIRRHRREPQRFERVRIGGTRFSLAPAERPRRKGMLRRWLSALATKAAAL